MNAFYHREPSLESQWRAVILFGRNSATYKFAFAQALLDVASAEHTHISLEELATPYAGHIIRHLRQSDTQGTAKSSKFLQACRAYMQQEIAHEQLLEATVRFGFANVIDAFPIVNEAPLPQPFYEKDYQGRRKKLVVTNALLQLKESPQFANFIHEVDARWSLVETAWNYNIRKSLLAVRASADLEKLYIEEQHQLRRVNITSVRHALNGYQQGKCFYTQAPIYISTKGGCHVDHFLPHAYQQAHLAAGTDLNQVWNLVLAEPDTNLRKGARVPQLPYLEKLYQRNEWYIESKHPLAETIINQTGLTPKQRRQFLQQQYDLAKRQAIHIWEA